MPSVVTGFRQDIPADFAADCYGKLCQGIGDSLAVLALKLTRNGFLDCAIGVQGDGEGSGGGMIYGSHD